MWYVVARDAWVLQGTLSQNFATLPEAMAFCVALVEIGYVNGPFRRYSKPFVCFRRVA